MTEISKDFFQFSFKSAKMRMNEWNSSFQFSIWCCKKKELQKKQNPLFSSAVSNLLKWLSCYIQITRGPCLASLSRCRSPDEINFGLFISLCLLIFRTNCFTWRKTWRTKSNISLVGFPCFIVWHVLCLSFYNLTKRAKNERRVGKSWVYEHVLKSYYKVHKLG